MVNVSFSLKDKNAKGLDHLAEAMDRPRSWLANEAIERYLEHHAWMDRKTDEAIAAVDAGAELIPHEEVVAEAEARAKTRQV